MNILAVVVQSGITQNQGLPSHEGVMKDEPIDDLVGFGHAGADGNWLCWRSIEGRRWSAGPALLCEDLLPGSLLPSTGTGLLPSTGTRLLPSPGTRLLPGSGTCLLPGSGALLPGSL